jgi:arginyl-tRNA synthetase
MNSTVFTLSTGARATDGIASLPAPKAIERLLYRFPEIVERAGKEYAPHYITTYLIELAGAFNNFYAHEQVIGDSPESAYRLAIVDAFSTVLKNGLDILGIPTPERV